MEPGEVRGTAPTVKARHGIRDGDSMEPMTRDEMGARIDALQTLREEHKLTREQTVELHELMECFEVINGAYTPTPGCCEEMRIHPAAIFCVEIGSDSRLSEGRWLASYETKAAGPRHYDTPAIAKFCPYCATPMPKMRRRRGPLVVSVITDGGYYCDTCSKRLSQCSCLPPEAAFVVDGGEVCVANKV
jgi:hypothetical protein